MVSTSDLALHIELPGIDSEHEDRIRSRLTGLVAVFDALRDAYELPAPSTELVVTSDFVSAVQGHGAGTIGSGELATFTTDRAGGRVMGKTMFRDDAHSEIVIVVDSEPFEAEDPVAVASQIVITSHELAHGLIGQLRAAGGPALPGASMPFDIPLWLTRRALEEYHADSVANAVLGIQGTTTLPDGTVRPLRSSDLVQSASDFTTTALDAFASVIAVIDHGREEETIDPDDWITIVDATGFALIALAHAQAEVDQSDSESLVLEWQAALEADCAPLAEAWSVLAGLAREVTILCPPAAFRQAECSTLNIGRDAILECWRSVGLTFTLTGSGGFNIHIADTSACWPGSVQTD